MKSILSVTALSVALSSVPAMAENSAPFHAVSQLSMEAEGSILPAHPAGLTKLTDAQLDEVKGGIFFLPAVLGYVFVGPYIGDQWACMMHGAIPGC